ncbi:MAG: leucine--tRNA ligase [Candidatus Shapirobacteria bacterium]
MNHNKIEKKWQKYWEENKTFYTDIQDFSKPKYYVLDMFPYTSGQGLHVGHAEGYTATDIISRMKRMQGFNVLHPMGFDSFGLPSEQYAIKTGNHPEGFTLKNIDNFIVQLKMLGFDFDWSKKVITCDPKYYKWTQWIFKQMYNDGLAKYIDMPVNWCEELGTVLANDEVVNGKSERGSYPVIRKNMKQWIMDMPAYAQQLIDGLDEIDWPESTKEMQKNWIGKSNGAEILFTVDKTNNSFSVFTTRPDTLFGVTYCVLSPEHDLVNQITTNNQKEEILNYKQICASKSEFERTEVNKNKTGVFTGSYAVNPVNNTKIPIWISDYVLSSYGTGAIMAVPAHDSRDYEFAKKFNLKIIPVIKDDNETHINSQFIDGLNTQDSINEMILWLEKNKTGIKKVNYKIREWIFARQRYWGEPVPIIHMEDGTMKLLDDKDLPLLLPEVDNYKAKNGKAPLDNAIHWKNVVIDGNNGIRETNTMPGSAASSWYFLRYIDPNNDQKIADKQLLQHWMPVDLYIGGAEHTVGHLLYSRFWNKYLYNKGISPVKEPFKRLCHQGMILGANNEKMSKSKGNVVSPNDIIKSHGADALRLYLMFMGPINADKPWSTTGIDGSKKFIDRVWRLYNNKNIIQDTDNIKLEKIYHQTVQKVTQDFENLAFNTAISQMMIFTNAVYKEDVFPLEYAKGFIKLLNPITPFFTEEIWQKIFYEQKSIATESWPLFNKNLISNDTFNLVVQINNKIIEIVPCEIGTTKEHQQEIALLLTKIKTKLENKKITRIISISGKLVNIIAE